jgi:hypothetical protein
VGGPGDGDDPVAHGEVEAVAEVGPLGLEEALVKSRILVVEFPPRDFEEFGEVDFFGALADEAAVEDELGGVRLFLRL